jgi:hypothetical protein
MMGNIRTEFIDTISKHPGDHIVFVHYSDGPQKLYEWVYNSPDIGSQRVIFVHALDPVSNSKLRRHYRHRSVWVLNVQNEKLTLTPQTK